MATACLQQHEVDLPAQIHYPLSHRNFSPLELEESFFSWEMARFRDLALGEH